MQESGRWNPLESRSASMSPGIRTNPANRSKNTPERASDCNLGVTPFVWPDVNQVPQPAQAPQAPQTPQIVRVAPAQPVAVEAITTAEQVQAAHLRLDRLRSELQDAAERRNAVVSRLRTVDNDARDGYLQRLGVLDERIITIEREITQVNMRLSTAPPQALVAAAEVSRSDPDVEAFKEVMDEIVPIIAILSIFVFMPIAVAIARLIWRRATNAPRHAPVADHGTQQKLDHLQQAVDTIAIEVERISEGQRFVTKLMSDRSLGSGAAEPVRVGGAKSALPTER